MSSYTEKELSGYAAKELRRENEALGGSRGKVLGGMRDPDQDIRAAGQESGIVRAFQRIENEMNTTRELLGMLEKALEPALIPHDSNPNCGTTVPPPSGSKFQQALLLCAGRVEGFNERLQVLLSGIDL